MDAKALCDMLVANDATLTELRIDLFYTNDAELKLILDAAKKNKTVKTVSVIDLCERGPMSVHAVLLLASVVSEHPEIQEIKFDHTKFIEFGPIALAIHQNRNLTRLVVHYSLITPNLVECIRWLLTENAIKSLTLETDKIANDGIPHPFDISDAFLGNSSLTELHLTDLRGAFGSETYNAVAQMIRTNQDFEKIDLFLSDTMPNRYEFVGLVAQAAEGHASLNKLAINLSDCRDLFNSSRTAKAIGNMLHNAPALREFSLTRCLMGSAGAPHLAEGLCSKNSVVEYLDVSWCMVGDKEAAIFARVLLANSNLKYFVLGYNSIGDPGAREIAVALRQNNTLEILDLKSNGIGSNGASALAGALLANDALKDLNLRSNTIGNYGATSIAEMLTRNECIEKVCIGPFGEKGLQAFATHLSDMKGLKSLDVSASGGYTSEIGNSFVLALEQNTTLEKFFLGAMYRDVEVIPQVEHLLALNRGGRQLLTATGESVPPLNYWPRIIARSSDNANVLFHFLRKIPNVLLARAGSKKRKRGDDN
jgi:hypothetical protein